MTPDIHRNKTTRMTSDDTGVKTTSEEERKRWFRLAALVMLFAASLIITRALRLRPGDLSIIWLPQGIMVGTLLILERRDYPVTLVIFAVGVLVDLLIGGMGAAPSLVLAFLRTGSACVIVWLYLAITKAKSPLNDTRSIAVLAGTASFGCAVSATLGAMIESSANSAVFDQAALQWFLAPLLGALALSPMITEWFDASSRGSRIAVNLELAVILAGIVLSGSIVFFVAEHSALLPLSSAFILMPWLIWAALRRPSYETVTLTFVTILVARFEMARNLAINPAGPYKTGMHVNWVIFALLLLTILMHFLVVKTRERNAAERRLHEREIRFDTVFNTSPDAVIVIDRKGVVEAFNQAAEKLFAFRAKEVIGNNIKMLMPPYLAQQHDGYMNRYITTGEKRIIGIGRVVTGQRSDGSTFPMELAVGEANINGERFFTGFVRDLSEKQGADQRIHELQNELMHASRLASLGEIYSTIAHEVNQPLSAAGTYLEIAEELTRTNDRSHAKKLPETLGKAAAQVKRAAEIIRRVRDFARKRTPELALENVNRVIEEACALAFVGVKNSGIKGSMEFSSDLPAILLDKIQIQQVIVNLVRNSIDAMESSRAGRVMVRSRLAGSGFVEVGVIDNGPGVPEEIRAGLFSPFTTSKVSGTGLGLAVCKSIVDAHGGRLWYEPAPAGGAAFTFTLPVSMGEKDSA